jgi:hypothetical protein
VDEVQRLRARDVEQFLRRVNKLLRWYRTVTRRAEVTELTAAQASPFQFALTAGTGVREWVTPYVVEATGPQPASLTPAETSRAVRDGLRGGNDPDVAALFLLDAERALHQGRFRETVLFSWSTIDSVFNRQFDLLANTVLDGERSEARKFITGTEFGLRHKMTAAMHLLANRSLYREPEGFWEQLSASYGKRNRIIHRGENAAEEEAILALNVARRVVDIMESIPIPGAGAPQQSIRRNTRRRKATD